MTHSYMWQDPFIYVMWCIHVCDMTHPYNRHDSFIPVAALHTATHCNTLQHTCHTLQHAATHCNTLQHTATHYNTLQHTATHCNTQQHTAIYCNTPATPRPVAAEAMTTFGCHTSTLLSVDESCQTTTHYNTLQHTATHRHTAIQRNTLTHEPSLLSDSIPSLRCLWMSHVKLQHSKRHTTTYCNILSYTATHHFTLQHTATHCNTSHHYFRIPYLHFVICGWVMSHVKLQHTATHSNILQHTAPHCNTLQHIETQTITAFGFHTSTVVVCGWVM